MNALECEFLAENVLLDIVPNFTDDVVHLICGDVGPFEASMVARVPAWLALYLKRRHKCRIVPPDWLTVNGIQEMINTETTQEPFSGVPAHFMELAHLLLRECSDDVPDSDQLKTLVHDMWDSRVAKMRTSTVKFLQSGEQRAELNNLTQMEITYARTSLRAATNHVNVLQANARDSR
uniref:DNA replication complex GINS protein PSF2 n=1 Tax=Plectus sambesii TaxID=2011161 RepID=A0A914WYX9_9BILA